MSRAADPAAQPLAVVEAKPDAGTLLRAIAQAAANPAVDIEKMERLFAMQQKIVAQDAEAAFNAAMARAQAQIVPVANNAYNDQTSSGYAKLSQINKAIMPVYTAEGLSVSFDTEDSPVKDHMRTVAIVSHAAGHSRRYHLDMPFDAVGIKGSTNKTMVHATGSTASYSRRYLVCMIFNVATEDDNDGNNGAGKTGAQAQVQQPLAPDAKAGFESAIETCAESAALRDIWQKIVVACKEAKDKPAYDALKVKVTARATAIKSAQ